MKSKYTFNEIEELLDKTSKLKISDVTVSNLLTNGKKIATIRIDNFDHNLFAPATYAWSEIDGRPTNLSQFTDDVASGKYLPLAGGTIRGSGYDILTIESSSEGAALKLKGAGATKGGYLIYLGGSTWRLSDDGWSTSYTILHAGNVGNYALKTDGTNGMNYGANITWGDENANLEDYEGYSSGFRLLHYSTSSREFSGGIHVGTRYGWQLVRNASTETMRIRYSDPDNKSWGDWKTIAFTDSNITGNAASANGFARAFTNVANADLNTALAQGGIASDYDTHMSKHWQNAPDGAFYGSVIQFFTDNRLDAQLLWDINHGNSDDTTRSLWWRARDYRGFDNAKWHQIAFTDSNVASAQALVHSNGTVGATVNSSGNVTIGGQDYAGTGYRLWVNGATNVEGNLRMTGELIFAGGYSIQSYNNAALSLNPQGNNILLSPNGYGNVLIGTVTDNGAKLNVHGGLFVNKYQESGKKDGAYVIINKGDSFFGIGGSASGVYKMSFGTTSDAIGTWKNEIMTFLDSGHVGIGNTNPEYKLDVNGKIFAREQIYSDVGFILRTSDGKGSRASFSHSSNTLYIQSGYNDGSSAVGRIMLSGVSTNHLASLEVRALKSAFDGRLIVGSTNDDGTSYLQVSGTSTFGGQSTFNAGITIPSGQSITFVDANGNNHVLSWDDTAGGLKIDDKIITVN